MGKFYIFLLGIFILACNSPEKQGIHKDLWTFEASNNNPQLDDLCSLIL